MFSVIIPTHDSERALVPTLAALVPGATAGIVREVIVADAESRDQTEEVADIAGCRFVASSKPLGLRLNEAAASARGDWLMFLRPGTVPGPTWIDETIAFFEQTDRRNGATAAVFSETDAVRSLLARLRLMPASARQGLVIGKAFYVELGGHRDTSDPETALLRRIGRRRIVTLSTPVSASSI